METDSLALKGAILASHFYCLPLVLCVVWCGVCVGGGGGGGGVGETGGFFL